MTIVLLTKNPTISNTPLAYLYSMHSSEHLIPYGLRISLIPPVHYFTGKIEAARKELPQAPTTTSSHLLASVHIDSAFPPVVMGELCVLLSKSASPPLHWIQLLFPTLEFHSCNYPSLLYLYFFFFFTGSFPSHQIYLNISYIKKYPS